VLSGSIQEEARHERREKNRGLYASAFSSSKGMFVWGDKG